MQDDVVHDRPVPEVLQNYFATISKEGRDQVITWLSNDSNPANHMIRTLEKLNGRGNVRCLGA